MDGIGWTAHFRPQRFYAIGQTRPPPGFPACRSIGVKLVVYTLADWPRALSAGVVTGCTA